MALQPKRTWSAEDERRRRLEEDPDAYDVGPHSVTCAGCHRPIRLNATGRYYAANWNKHKMGCKNTHAVNGANAMSAESKFTGRVAAFRVAKPTESCETFSLSSVHTASTAQEFDRIRAESARLLHPQPRTREPLSSWTDQRAPEDLAAGGRHTRSPASYADQSTSSGGGTTYDHSQSTSRIGTRLINSGSNRYQSPASLVPRRPSRSPSGPSPRYDNQDSCGPIDAPFREEPAQRSRTPHGFPSFGFQRTRADSTPSHHSEDPSHRIAYLRPQVGLPDSPFIPDKGKWRYIEHALSDSQSDQHPPVSAELQSRNKGNGLDQSLGQTGIPNVSGCLSKAQNWRESCGNSDLDSNSTSSPQGLGAERENRPKRTIGSHSPKLLFQDNLDDRVLPPLSSLSLTRSCYLGAAPTGSQSLGCASKVHHDSSRVTFPPGEGHSWRERTRAWVQTGTTCLLVDRISPESVVLPPIRSVSGLPQGSPTGKRRRQREDGENDGDYMDEDRPSPPKVVVLPLSPLHPSSALRTDDLSSEHKHTLAHSDEDSNIGGDSTLVGNQSQPGQGILRAAARQNTPRLHPVWKWEQKGEARSAEAEKNKSDTMH